MAPKTRCYSSSPLWRHPHGTTASRSLASASTSKHIKNGPVSLPFPRITPSLLSTRTSNAHHDFTSKSNSFAQNSKRSLSFQAPTTGRRLISRNTITPLIATKPSWNSSALQSSVALNMTLRSAGSSLATTETKRGFITNTEQKEAEDVVSFYDDRVTQVWREGVQTLFFNFFHLLWIKQLQNYDCRLLTSFFTLTKRLQTTFLNHIHTYDQ